MRITDLMKVLKQKYGTLNPYVICDFMDIEIRYVDFLDNPRGQYNTILGDKVILLSNSIRDTNQEVFVCSHELGHALFHTDTAGYYSLNNATKSTSEYEANYFATHLVFELYKEEHDFELRDLSLLTKEYGLPECFYPIVEHQKQANR